MGDMGGGRGNLVDVWYCLLRYVPSMVQSRGLGRRFDGHWEIWHVLDLIS